MQLLCIIALYILTACFTYSVYKDLRKPPEPLRTDPERIPKPEQQKPAGDRRQLEKIAANCLYRLLTPRERENINIFHFCRDASDTELTNIIERYKNEY